MDQVTRQNAALLAVRTVARPNTLPQPALPQPDPETLKRLKEAREQASEISKTLDQSKIDVGKQRKQAAKERLELIKNALRTLKMVGGDARTMAKEGARLARELAAAVKEYTSAGGTDATAAPSPTAAPAQAQAKAQAQVQPQAGESAENPKIDAEGAVPATDAPAGEDAPAEKAAPTEKSAKDDGEPTDGFADDARTLAKKLKAFLNRQKEQLKAQKGEGGEQAEREVKAGLDSLRQIDHALGGLPGNGGDPLASVDITV